MEVVKFEDLNISENTKRALKEIRYNEMTEIQKQAIPIALQGRDVIGQSQTGTGKTASFGIPIIEKINKNSKKIQAIVLCPTRELAIQVTHSIRRYLKYQDNIKCMAIYGGESIEKQILGLKKGVQIIIGTPGRVIDHMRRRTIRLDNVKMVVLDEADEMLNMGFEQDIEKIIKHIPKDRQTLLFSATMNERILKISRKYLKNPENIKIKSEELTVENIKQISVDLKIRMKNEAVCRILDVVEPKKAIIFCNTKKRVDSLIEFLKQKGYKAECLHGDLRQNQRDIIIKKMRKGEINVLVATDVAARGIDIKGLELVINYDIPQEPEYYVHRIGRTGRNGKNGIAYTFYTGKEKIKIEEIEKYANTKIIEGNIPSAKEVDNLKNKKFLENIEEIIKKREFKNIEIIENFIDKKYSYEDISKALITILTEKENYKNSEYEYTPDENGNVRLLFNVGKKDNIMVKDILGCIKSNTVIKSEQIGNVDLNDNFTFVEISSDYVYEIMRNVNGQSIKNKKVNIEIVNSK